MTERVSAEVPLTPSKINNKNEDEDEKKAKEDKKKIQEEEDKADENIFPPFQIASKTLQKIIDGYRTRKVGEFLDLDLLKQQGGVEGISKKLNIDIRIGLSDTENKADRERVFGSNKRPKKEPKTFCQILWDVFKDPMLRILLLSSIVSIAIGVATADPEDRPLSWLDGFGIFVAIALVSLFSAINDYTKQNQFLKLNEKADADKKVTVMRNGKWLEKVINEDELLVGDIVKITNGNNIPADGIIITEKGVETDESAMTGESHHLKKKEYTQCHSIYLTKAGKNELTDMNLKEVPSPVLLSGTQLFIGDATFLVVAVGGKSCVGKILKNLEGDDEDDQTPLQEKLEAIAGDIGKVGLITAIATVVALFIRFFVTRGVEGGWSTSDIGTCFQYIVLGITVLVVAIPEGLPMAVTIALAYSVRKMYEQNNLVKQLISCETMGGANNICTDKTGTLTANKMSVLKICLEGRVKDIDPNLKNYQIQQICENPNSFNILKESISCNTFGTKIVGHATEKALLFFLDKFGIDAVNERNNIMGENFTRFHFTSNRKKMSTIIFNANCPSKHRIHIKGSFKIILNSCKYYLAPGNKIEVLTDHIREKFSKINDGMNTKALRTLGIAYKNLEVDECGEDHSQVNEKGENIIEEDNMILIALVGIRDTLRENVPEAVDRCHEAGITVRMVTGDNPTIAKAIGLECHILEPNYKPESIMEGKDFYNLLGGLKEVCEKCDKETCNCEDTKKIEKVANIEKFKEIKDILLVVALSRPEDKYLLVSALKELDEVVAVTGDGTNDAMALKKANVGFSMGIAGTDIAKNAAHIILLDDNFASIITAILWGRNIYGSIQKFIQFQLSVNIVALATAFTSACVLTESPLRPIQLLWVNLVMDSLASLALATDPPTDDLLLMPPYKKDDYIITKTMMKHIIGQAVYQIAVLFIILFVGEYFIPEDSIYINNIHFHVNGHIRTGRRYGYNGKEDFSTSNLDAVELYSKQVFNKIGPSRHYTFFFATFIFLQIVNEFNCRKLYDEFNFLAGFQNNLISIIVRAAETILSVIFIQFGNRIFYMCTIGLTWYHWLLAVTFGMGSILIRYSIIIVDKKICCAFGQRSLNENEVTINNILRKPSRTIHNLERRPSRSEELQIIKSGSIRDVNENSVSETKNLIKSPLPNLPNEEVKTNNYKNNLRPNSKENPLKDLKRTEDVEQLNDVNDEKNSSRRLNETPDVKVIPFDKSRVTPVLSKISENP